VGWEKKEEGGPLPDLDRGPSPKAGGKEGASESREGGRATLEVRS
jgi:hypothetical protein